MVHKLNWKHILIHFVGMWLFAHAFQTYAFLNNVEVAEVLRTSNDTIEIMTVVSLSKLNVSIALGYSFGGLVSLIVSIVICIRRKWFYLNSIFSFACLIILSYFDLTGWVYLKQIFLLPGEVFNGKPYYIVNGTIMLAIGAFFLLWKSRIYKHYFVGASKSPHYA